MFKKGGLDRVYYRLVTHTLKQDWHSFALAVAAVVLCSAVSGEAQPRRRAAERKPAANFAFATGHNAVIPFDFSDNAIVLQVRVNDSAPMKFFFEDRRA